MGLTRHHGTGYLALVGFYCDECEYRGGSSTGYYHPSFFIDAYDMDWADQKKVTKEIKRHFLGTGSLTQKRVEEFFRNDENFARPAPGFLRKIVKAG